MTFRKQTVLAAAMSVLATAGGAETTLIHGEAGPNQGARAGALQWFADQVAERSGGDLRIDIQWDGALFNAKAAMQSIGDGVADMGSVIAVYYPQDMAGYGIADLPMNNPDAWVDMRATDELMRTDAMQKSFADRDLRYIGTWTTPPVNIGCKDTAIRSVADIEGKKLRAVLDQTGSDMADEFGRLITGANGAAITSMKEQGVEIIEMADADRAKLVASGEKFLDQWVVTANAGGLDGATTLATHKELLAKYTAERDANGYPWENASN